ncbi:hypothetical protein IHE44_0011305 [Lamprotornis superbus]|uniref:Major intrinsically disordered Notch2-binding receptor 1-like C-terminal domain-containing protein n=1 Tax=Lamprotornis superbus TaxID=245042 RepID=A0A835NG53_9PASS|nr:hypothetical protein IHE44_0011305 [Lamprotornis superbus]
MASNKGKSTDEFQTLEETRWHSGELMVDGLEIKREKRTVTELPGLDLNRVSQEIIDKSLGKHITPITLKSTIKSNPLYSDIYVDDDWEEKKKTPSWTVQDYDRQSLHSNLASHIKENPNDLQFWMGDIYTPGYDTLLKKKEREKKHSKYCRIILLMVLAICILITAGSLKAVSSVISRKTANNASFSTALLCEGLAERIKPFSPQVRYGLF